MIEKTFTFVDYEGNERTEVHYFNLTETERLEMEVSTDGGMTKMINKIVADQNGPEIMRIFKELILKAYGEKSPDGRRFVKSAEISKAFSETEAYNQLFMELVTDATAAGNFVEGLATGNNYKIGSNKNKNNNRNRNFNNNNGNFNNSNNNNNHKQEADS